MLKRLADRKTSLRCVLDREDIAGIGDLMANTLSIDLRLLHHIIEWIFLPKIGRFDFVSKRGLVLMYYLIQVTSMSLPGMMLVQMKKAAERVKACLPYDIY